MTLRDMLGCPPRGAAGLVAVSLTSAPPQPDTGRNQHDTGRARNDAMLEMEARDAGFVAGEETRQLIGRDKKIDGGDNEQDDAEHSQHWLHGFPRRVSSKDLGHPDDARACSPGLFIALPQRFARAAGSATLQGHARL
jgi:hypothetical protein